MAQQKELFGTKIWALPKFEEELKDMPDIHRELRELRNTLWDNPGHGQHIAGGIYKIRIPISSQGRGKRFGGRVISVAKMAGNIKKVYLLRIYDKTKKKGIPRSELIKLAKSLGVIH